ncbi:acyl-CoA dehydrogenase family protein [Xylophilus sp.]|uniref:acyl-CoA dehydrogenase family protein n=1 Tax=Xylophilus sp. TaxID=2653893 RepID=UPI0013B7C517|nr:acyl-CoA dehydrogenase family protein [Xylophilus sp.]KAF1045279.1 MAG: Acryloyl-CoA reductase (NADH) [Xylophilus sp.]
MPAELLQWLDAHAESLDNDATHASEVIPRLAQAGLFGIAVPRDLGGRGGTLPEAIEAIADVAGRSLSAAFAFWGHRAFIEYVLQTPNVALRERWLPGLLAGTLAGATGLSNAMKYLCGIEQLNVRAQTLPGPAWKLQGSVPWCTNLRLEGSVAAVAVSRGDGGAPLVAALPSDRAGVVRSADLDLIALRGSNTAALAIEGALIEPSDLLHEDANRFLPQVRPAFLGLQLGLSIGLARSSLQTARERAGGGREVVEPALIAQRSLLDRAIDAVYEGLADGRFLTKPHELFRLRLALADVVAQALQLELQASGGRAYHRDQPSYSFARRWREAAFIPIVTPSITQLQGELARCALRDAAPAA